MDDSPDFLTAMTDFLLLSSDVSVVGQALSGQEAIELVAQTRPDLILVDLLMPGMNGLETTRHLRRTPCAPRVVIVTSYDDPAYRDAATRAGASDYLVKAELGQTLLPLLHRLFAKQELVAVSA